MPDGDAPLSSELRHCTAYPEFRPEATWAQPLGPGRAVLTRGVSRRSGSVAYIRADASPTEVLAVSILAPQSVLVKRIGKEFGIGPKAGADQSSQPGPDHMGQAHLRSGRPRLDDMATTLQDHRVAEALDRMYAESREQMPQLREHTR